MKQDEMQKLGQLIDPSISVGTKEFAQFTATNVFVATPHIGRDRGVYALPKNLGFESSSMDDEGTAFLADRVSAGNVCLVPKDAARKLETLEAQLRNAVKSAAICDSYIPVASYEALCRRFAEIKSAYLLERDRLIAEWDILVQDFESGAKSLLSAATALTPQERVQTLGALMNGLPTKEKFKSSFYMSLDITAFPAAEPPEGLDASLSAAIASGTENQLYSFALQSIEALLGKAWSLLTTAANSYIRDERVHPRTLMSMATLAVDFGVKNVFGNKVISSLKGTLDRIAKDENIDRRQASVEDAILDVWEYCHEVGISLDVNISPWSPKELDDMLSTRAWVEQNQMKIAGA